MITPFPLPEDDADASRPEGVERVAAWASAVVSRMSGEESDVLPGIVSPLELRADFAVNTQTDAASVTLGNGVAVFTRAGGVPSSGALTLSLRWSPGYRAAGLRAGELLVDDWVVELVEATRVDLSHAALGDDRRETPLPVVTIVKPSAAVAGDEFTARLQGAVPECRDAAIRGWSHG